MSSLDVAPTDTGLITLADLERAAARLAPVAVRTPLLPFDHVSELLGAEVWLKPEMLQRSGAFKFRGAYNFLAQLGDDERRRGVVRGRTIRHATPRRRHVKATPWPWLPALAQTTPVARSASVREAMKLYAPRSL